MTIEPDYLKQTTTIGISLSSTYLEEEQKSLGWKSREKIIELVKTNVYLSYV